MFFNSDAKIKQQIAENISLLNLSAKERDKIISVLMDNASRKINIAILDLLTDEQKQELEVLAKSNNKDNILTYLNERIGNLQGLVEKVTEEVILDFMEKREQAQGLI